MTRFEMKMFFEDVAQYLSWEEFQRCMITPEDSYAECTDKFRKVLNCFPQTDYQAWEYFKTIYDDIPVQFRIPLMLGGVYQCHYVDYPEMLNYISHYLDEETTGLRNQRIAINKAALGRRVRKDGNVKVYRGMAEHSLLEEFAVSFTLDKKIADIYVENRRTMEDSRFGTTICRLVNIKDILCYSNGIDEKEVCIIPTCIHEGYLIEFWEDLEYLDEDTLSGYFPNNAINNVMHELSKERRYHI